MLKKVANIFGIVFLLIGVLGFVPGITSNGFLLSIFEVNTLHNLIHLITGALALWAGMTSVKAAKLYFQVFGVIYALVAVLGLLSGSVLGIIEVNGADNILHIIIAVVALYAGFGMKADGGMGAPSTPMAPPRPMM